MNIMNTFIRSPMIRELLKQYFWKGLPDDVKKYVS